MSDIRTTRTVEICQIRIIRTSNCQNTRARQFIQNSQAQYQARLLDSSQYSVNSSIKQSIIYSVFSPLNELILLWHTRANANKARAIQIASNNITVMMNKKINKYFLFYTTNALHYTLYIICTFQAVRPRLNRIYIISIFYTLTLTMISLKNYYLKKRITT